MKIIQHNPYRIAGILSNVSARELQKQKGKITAFSIVGKEISSELDFDFLNPIVRTEQSIGEAFSNIEQNQDKVNHSLFWFLKSSPFDETAISYLIQGDSEKAKEIWGKVTNGKEVNSKNYSAFNNIGTLKLLSGNNQEVTEGVKAKIQLIESEYFEAFVHAVADKTFTIDNEKQSQKLIDELLIQLKSKHSDQEIVELFSSCNKNIQKHLSKKFTEGPIHNIESNIESTKRKRKNNKVESYSYGKGLYKNIKQDLNLLKSLLGESDLNYKRIADQLAKEVMQCGIDFFNESQEIESDDNYHELSMELAKLAESIAVGSFTKDKAKDNSNSLEEMKDRELSQAIQFLQSVKDAYINNESDIMEQVRTQEATLVYGESINYSRVQEMIQDSINWDKVVELISEIIPSKNINKIKNSNNRAKINEYISLVEFILNKINYFNKSEVKYLNYWEVKITVKSPSPSTRTTTSTHSTEDNGIPSWILWVAGFLLFIVLIKSCN